MAAVSLDAHFDFFNYGKCNIAKNCSVADGSCSIENSLKQFIRCVHIALIRHVFHEAPMQNWPPQLTDLSVLYFYAIDLYQLFFCATDQYFIM